MSGGAPIRAIVIRGDFTAGEFAELVATIRRLDERRPGAQFEIVAADPGNTALETAEALMRDALPAQPGRHTTILPVRR